MFRPEGKTTGQSWSCAFLVDGSASLDPHTGKNKVGYSILGFQRNLTFHSPSTWDVLCVWQTLLHLSPEKLVSCLDCPSGKFLRVHIVLPIVHLYNEPPLTGISISVQKSSLVFTPLTSLTFSQVDLCALTPLLQVHLIYQCIFVLSWTVAVCCKSLHLPWFFTYFIWIICDASAHDLSVYTQLFWKAPVATTPSQGQSCWEVQVRIGL